MDAVKRLLAKDGVDVNQARKEGPEGWMAGATALYHASRNGHKDVVRFLLQAGANVNQANKNGSTPLNIASENGHTEMVGLLLQAGADANQANKHGETPLNKAIENGRTEMVRFLLQAGADPNLPVGRNCPLQLACNTTIHIQCVEYLLRHEKICIPPEIEIHDQTIVDKLQRYKKFQRNVHIRMCKHFFKTIPTDLIRKFAFYII